MDTIHALARQFKTAGLKYRLDYTGSHDGQQDGVVYVYTDDADMMVKGKLEFSDFEGEVYINMIEVVEDMRRQGIGTALMERLKQEYPGVKINTGMTTEDGTEFAKLLSSKTATWYHFTNNELPSEMIVEDTSGRGKGLFVLPYIMEDSPLGENLYEVESDVEPAWRVGDIYTFLIGTPVRLKKIT